MNKGVKTRLPRLKLLSDRSTVIENPQLKASSASTNNLTVICFHGSGDSAAQSWTELARMLNKDCDLILFDRSFSHASIEEHVRSVWEYLRSAPMPSSYLLLAHSYGGSFAKQFLYQHSDAVGGMVLVETGKSQEPGNIAGYRPWNGGKVD